MKIHFSVKIYFIFLAVSLLLLIVIISTSCNNKEQAILPSSDIHLIGKWDIEKLVTKKDGKTETLSKRQLDSLDAVWIYVFNSDNTMEQTADTDSSVVTMPVIWTAGGKSIDNLTHSSKRKKRDF